MPHDAPQRDAVDALRQHHRVQAGTHDRRANPLADLGLVVGTFADAPHDNAAPAQNFARELLQSHGASGAVVRDQVIPLLDLVEGSVRHAGRDVLAPHVDARLAVLDIAGALVLHAIGALIRALLWTGEDARELDRTASRAHFVALAERLLLTDGAGGAGRATAQ